MSTSSASVMNGPRVTEEAPVELYLRQTEGLISKYTKCVCNKG